MKSLELNFSPEQQVEPDDEIDKKDQQSERSDNEDNNEDIEEIVNPNYQVQTETEVAPHKPKAAKKKKKKATKAKPKIGRDASTSDLKTIKSPTKPKEKYEMPNRLTDLNALSRKAVEAALAKGIINMTKSPRTNNKQKVTPSIPSVSHRPLSPYATPDKI